MQWALTLALGVPSALLIAFNWVSLAAFLFQRHVRGREGGFSFCPPVLCGVTGGLACIACPWPEAWHCAWLPLVLDPSIATLAVCAPLHLLARATGGRSPWDRPALAPLDTPAP